MAKSKGIINVAKDGKTNKDLVPIYTDWANHHLGKAGRKRQITDLQRDMTDSLFLVDVIEAVTGERVPEIQTKPRSQLQEVENIAACLAFAQRLGVNVDGLTPNGIGDGQLKTILGLFFSLSRYKQECKAKAAAPAAVSVPSSPSLRTPQPPTPSRIAPPMAATESKLKLVSSIPSPARSALGSDAALRSPGKGLVTINGKGPGIPRSNPSSAASTPAKTGLKAPSSRLAPPKATPKASGLQKPSTAKAPPSPANGTMLEKFRLFSKDSKAPPAAKGSRLSNSSSGFSSAKSETSDSTYAHIPALSKDEATPKPGSTFKSMGKKSAALKPPKVAKAVKPPKVSGGSQTSTNGDDCGGTDADSAYGGHDESTSNSPGSSAPSISSTSSKSESGLRKPGLRPPTAAAVLSPTSSAKPTMAVKAFPAGGSGLRPPGTKAPAGIPKPSSSKLKPSSSTAERLSAAASGPPSLPCRSLTSAELKREKRPPDPPKEAPPPIGSPTIGVVSPMTHHRPLPRPAPASAADLGYDATEERGEERGSTEKVAAPKAVVQQKPAKPTRQSLETTFGAAEEAPVAAPPERRESGSSDEGAVEAMQPLVSRAALFGPNRIIGLPEMHKGEDEVGYTSEGGVLLGAVTFNGPLAELSSGDLAPGYVSEGGISMYAQKMEARFREGLEAVRDSMRKPDPLHDSFEDSSSISSGISENFDEISTDDLTGSSLSGPEAGFGRGIGAGNPKVAATQRQILQLQQQKKALEAQKLGLKGSLELQARKATEQESIDALLQKCRTSARGLGPTPSRPSSAAMPPTRLYHTLNGPLDMRAAADMSVELSNDGEMLRVGSGRPSRAQLSTGKGLKLIRTGGPDEDRRPGSAQGGGFGGAQPGPNAFHSLDRKRHLIGAAYPPNHLYHHTNSALAAMVSPRRYPMPKGNLSLPMNQQDPNRPQWPRHSSSESGSQSARGPMSRSMIEHSPNLPRRSRPAAPSLRISPQDPDVCLDYPSRGAAQQRSASQQAAGPPPLSSRSNVSGRNSRSASSGGENIYANLIQRTSTLGAEAPGLRGLHKLSAGDANGGYPLSPSSSNGGVRGADGGYVASVLGRVGGGEGGDLRDSQLSLASNSSSFYSNGAERYEGDMRKLQREVDAYKDRIRNLNSQQASYSSIVQAFEKALERMAKKIQDLSVDKHRKDAEVAELRDCLREMSAAAGFSPQLSARSGVTTQGIVAPTSPALLRRHTFNSEAQQPNVETAQQSPAPATGIPHRQGSSESLVSSVSQRSSLSTNSSKGSKGDKNSTGSSGSKDSKEIPNGFSKNPKRSWIRSSFTRAFKGGKGPGGKGKGSMSDVEEASREESPSSVSRAPEPSASELATLRSELRERESVLTDARLDALTSRQQLDELRQQLSRLKTENSSLKKELTKERTHGGSQTSLQPPTQTADDHNDGTMSDCGPPGFHPRYEYRPSTSYGLSNGGPAKGIRVWVSGEMSGRPEGLGAAPTKRFLVGRLPMPNPGEANALTWHRLETGLAQLFNEYVHRIDPVSNLNLNFMDSVCAYRLGSQVRSPLETSAAGENGPFHCLTPGQAQDGLEILLHPDDTFALSSLVPKSTLRRQLRLLADHRRAFIAGSKGVGKSFLAGRLAAFIALRNCGDERSVETLVASEGPNSARDLKRRLTALVADGGPCCVVVEQLELVGRGELGELLSVLPSDASAGPFIIGTLADQSACHLQLQHDFRMILLTSHNEPVRGLLGRALRQRLVEREASAALSPSERTGLVQVVEWVGKVWAHLGRWAEGCGLGVGAELFLDCPLDSVPASRDWFVRLWNAQLQPVMAASPGPWAGEEEDPLQWILETWPWDDLAEPDDDGGQPPETLLKPLIPPAKPHSIANGLRIKNAETVAI